MARHRPEIYAATRFVLTPKDYCLRALAGVAVSDPMSNFFIVGKTLAYLEPLLARVEGAQERLAPLRAFTDVVGEIAGVQRQTRARRGGHDGRLERPVRRGRPRARTRAYMSGTSEILAAASRERGGAPGVVSFPEAAGLNIHAGPTQSDGDSLRWSGQTVGADVAGVLALAGQADRAGRPFSFFRTWKESGRRSGTRICVAPSSASTARREGRILRLRRSKASPFPPAGSCNRSTRRRARPRRGCSTPAAARAATSGPRSAPIASAALWIGSPVSTSAAGAPRSWPASASAATPVFRRASPQ